MSKTLPLSETKAHLSRLIDEIDGPDGEVVITKNGRAKAVLVSCEEYESWRESAEIRSDAGLSAEIRKGLAALKRRGTRLYTLDELFS